MNLSNYKAKLFKEDPKKCPGFRPPLSDYDLACGATTEVSFGCCRESSRGGRNPGHFLGSSFTEFVCLIRLFVWVC